MVATHRGEIGHSAALLVGVDNRTGTGAVPTLRPVMGELIAWH